jgi:hypothetical protein
MFGARCRRGEIFLDDDEEAFIAKRPFYLRPAPPLRYKNAPPSYRDHYSNTEAVFEKS